MNFRIIIPARYASSRLPGKPLCDIHGKPMIQHVYERARQSDAISVIVATDDARIIDACEKFGAQTCMTATEHISGTDRIAETVKHMNYSDEDIIVNVQGDQPLVAYENINQVARNLIADETANIATLCERIHDKKDLFNTSIVKVVFDHFNHALYFSRSLIPWVAKLNRLDDSPVYYKHIGLYAYRAKTIQAFTDLAPSALELSETLEQLRFLSYGERIHIDLALKNTYPEVNVLKDLHKIRKIYGSK